MDRNSLEQIVRDPHSTPQERETAALELGGGPQFTADTELPEAKRMLAVLGKEHVREITENEWESYFAKGHAPASEELIGEWRFFVPPDERMLELLTGQDHVGGLRWWWQYTLDHCGKREDVKAHALARLAEL
jgi:hypothetical protein